MVPGGPGVTTVLFVCLGNICRSPTAHGVFQSMVDDGGMGELIELKEVPDPYYGGANGFNHVLDLVEWASEGLLREIVDARPES
jgi:protein-tyrosine-phosphatase